jgi:hypothetical protein
MDTRRSSDNQAAELKKLRPSLSHPVNLSRQEYYLIQRLRQLGKNGRSMVLVECDGVALNWRVAGKNEGGRPEYTTR